MNCKILRMRQYHKLICRKNFQTGDTVAEVVNAARNGRYAGKIITFYAAIAGPD